MAASHPAFAVDKIWTGATNTAWGTNTNWTGNAPSAGDNAVFNSTFTNQPNVGNTSAGGIWMTGSIGQNVTISGSGALALQSSTINGTAGLGILVDNANAFTLTITAPLKIGNAQTWTNSSGNLLTIGAGGVDLNTKALTINGSGNTTISGVISNAGAFSKAGSGKLTLSNTGDTYTGQLTVQAGTLCIDTINNASANGELGNNALSVILGNTGAVTGTLEYNGATASATKKFTMATGGTGAFQVDTAGTTLTLSGVIDGSGALSKTGAGTLTLTGTNTYSGGSSINAGTVVVNAVASLGNVSGGLTINAGTLEVSTGFSTSRTITLGDAASTFQVDASQTYTVTSAIGGSGALNKTGSGIMVLNAANTYSGGTILAAGTLQLSGSGILGSTSGALTVNGGTLDLNGSNQGVGNFTGSGGTILNNATATNVILTIGNNNGTGGNYAGVIADRTSGTGTVALTKTGTGTITLSGTNTYTGATTVNGGSLFVNGSTASGSAITVNNSGTTLGGSGTINGSINVASSGANLSPGASGVGSTAILHTGAVTLASGSSFNVDINGTTAGTAYDQVSVAGAVNLGGILTSNLVVTAGASLAINQKFYILLNDGMDAISGTFAQGTTVTASNGDVFLINYADNGDGGTLGNDISLTVTALPEPSTYAVGILALCALGYHRRHRLRRLLCGRMARADKN
jgi:autotransporter-associated beta strand protein